jgi:transposase
MFALTEHYQYYFYRPPADMRRGFDGLCGLVLQEFNRLPQGGEVFLFLNRERNRLKLLHWEKGGFVLYYKRLESGTFNPRLGMAGENVCRIRWVEMVMMIEGIELAHSIQRKRYVR